MPALLGLVLTSAVAQLSAQTDIRTAQPVTAFTHVTVIPMDAERALPDQTVLVQGDRIVALGPAAKVQIPAGATQIEGAGKFLIPGLADMHAHVCRPPCNPTVAPLDDIYAEFLPYLANGVTTVRDMHSGGVDSPMFAARRAVASGAVVGPRIYTAGDPDNYIKRNNTSAEMAAASTALLKAAGHDFVKYNAWKGAVYDSVVAAARRTHLRLVGHAPPDRKLAEILNDRWATVDHLTAYLQYAMGLDGQWDMMGFFGMDMQALVDTAAWMQPTYPFPEKELAAIAAATRQAGVWNCPTLFTASGTPLLVRDRMRDGNVEEMEALQVRLRVLERVEEFHARITKALQDGGAGLLLCSDGTSAGGLTAAPIPGFSVQAELQLLVQAGLTPYQALATGTRNAAEFLGTLDSTGTVAVGKRADLVLLTGNPLRDIGATRKPAGVMVGGRWLPPTMFEEAKAQVLERFNRYPQSVLEQFFPELDEISSP